MRKAASKKIKHEVSPEYRQLLAMCGVDLDSLTVAVYEPVIETGFTKDEDVFVKFMSDRGALDATQCQAVFTYLASLEIAPKAVLGPRSFTITTKDFLDAFPHMRAYLEQE